MVIAAERALFANGGPFIVKYPKGDPAAKGVLARLDPSLKPGKLTKLRVVKEDLHLTYHHDRRWVRPQPPVSTPRVEVSAIYTIENPTDNEIKIDFGFPILRGIYVSPNSMMPRPDVRVRLGQKQLPATIISNSAIFGIIRERASEIIENGIRADKEMKRLVAGVRKTKGEERVAAREVLRKHLAVESKWGARDASLLVEYAGLDFGTPKAFPKDRGYFAHWSRGDRSIKKIQDARLGPLGAIGEKKATQFFARLAYRFDNDAASTYEAIFSAWGGDVRERSVDLMTGKVRPREISKEALRPLVSGVSRLGDPTIYARVAYLDPHARISEEEKKACRAILKNLPVVFTFAPMNLLHYQATFPARSKQTLSVDYSQYAYVDTKGPKSYQMSYVLHPATLWKDFGPIHLKIRVPENVGFRCSAPCKNGDTEVAGMVPYNRKYSVYTATLSKPEDKKGELFCAVSAADMDMAAVKERLARMQRTQKNQQRRK